ncbi:MAG: hypothetical protein HY954_07740 [Deltaproteobacteria bacterium]|nr:hypothetical protein [Deltaproteobacteria bacterium]
MTTETELNELTELDEPISPKTNIKIFADTIGFQSRVSIQYSKILNTEVGQKILKIFNNDSRILSLNGKMISRGSGGRIFEVSHLAMWFLWCVNEYGKKAAISHLKSFLDSDKIEVINTLWIIGVMLDESISLQDGYTIQALKDMPDSDDKEHFLKFRMSVHEIMNFPLCAITKPCYVNKLRPNDPEAIINDNPDFWNVSRRLNEIAMLLNAVKGIACVPYYATSYTPLTIPFGIFSSGGGGMFLCDIKNDGSTKLQSESITIINILIEAYEKLNTTEKEKFQRILIRLYQAKIRRQIEDKILDLGIALEMLLLDGKDEQLALSFRLRGSWLIGNSQNRKKIFEQLKKIYKFRSQVAHSGLLCEGIAEKIAHVRDTFPEYQSLAEDICQKIIKDGIPDWEKLILNSIENPE